MNPAFAYFYDAFVSDKKYEKELNDIEAEIANKNIGGRIARLAMFRNPREMMEDLIRGGAKNIVVVGNDDTLKKVIWSSSDLEPVFGYLPVGKPTELAELLGIASGKTAVDILAGRYIETLDVGKINDAYFLREIVITDPKASVAIEGQFSVKPTDDGTMRIRNTSLPDIRKEVEARTTGGLEIEVIPRIDQTSRDAAAAKTKLRFERARISGEGSVRIEVDGHAITETHFDISVIPKRLKFITGRRFLMRAV